jgi:NAD(P) transhydrogenase subunit alpha
MTALDPTVVNLIVFVLAVFVGYHVIWNVTPALHTPLMSVTNAISSVIIVGAILAAGAPEFDFGSGMGAAAVVLAAINVAGGFLVTMRMLEMFRKKKPKAQSGDRA